MSLKAQQTQVHIWTGTVAESNTSCLSLISSSEHWKHKAFQVIRKEMGHFISLVKTGYMKSALFSQRNEKFDTWGLVIPANSAHPLILKAKYGNWKLKLISFLPTNVFISDTDFFKLFYATSNLVSFRAWST